MYNDVNISGARIRTHDLWIESECVTHYATAPHKEEIKSAELVNTADKLVVNEKNNIKPVH